MFLSVLLIFSFIVIIIGLTTAKLNAKAPCDHHWIETDEGDIKCTKCFRMISHVHDDVNAETEIRLIKNQADLGRPVRHEGLKISPQVLKEAS